MIEGFALMMQVAQAKASAAGTPTRLRISPELFESLKAQERKSKGSAYLDIDKPGCFCGVPIELREEGTEYDVDIEFKV